MNSINALMTINHKRDLIVPLVVSVHLLDPKSQPIVNNTCSVLSVSVTALLLCALTQNYQTKVKRLGFRRWSKHV